MKGVTVMQEYSELWNNVIRTIESERKKTIPDFILEPDSIPSALALEAILEYDWLEGSDSEGAFHTDPQERAGLIAVLNSLEEGKKSSLDSDNYDDLVDEIVTALREGLVKMRENPKPALEPHPV